MSSQIPSSPVDPPNPVRDSWMLHLDKDDPTPVVPAADPEQAAAQEKGLLDDLRVVMTRRQEQRQVGPPEEQIEGRQIGHYLIQRLLGEGGMARVYQGMDLNTHAPVALKVLKPAYREDTRLCARFEREARSMARLRHAHVVRILDFPEFQSTRAIVMAYVPGGNLRKGINHARLTGQPQPVRACVDYLVQAASGVESAHRLGLVHRDIKPSNLLLDSRGRVQVADFGAILATEGATWLTGAGQQIGTPAYMSPEQCQGQRVGPPSDVYSLGVTLFELLTNRLPFEAEESSPFAIMLKHVSEPPPDPRVYRAELSEELAGVVIKCLAKCPEDRYATAGALAEALKAIPLLCLTAPTAKPHADAAFQVDMAAIRKQLEKLPQRAIVSWACRCARRVQHLNSDPRVERALTMAESSQTESPENAAPHAISTALSRIHALRLASLKAAYAEGDAHNSQIEIEAARAAAAAASAAAAVCCTDCAADAAYAARSAISALHLAGEPIREFWDRARADYRLLTKADLGAEGTVGRPIPPNLFAS